MSTPLKYPEDRYLAYDPGEGDMDRGTEASTRTAKIVTVRKPHACMTCPTGYYGPKREHDIQPGEKALFEKAVVDGAWASCYHCIPGVEGWLQYQEWVDHDDGREPPDCCEPQLKGL